MTTALAERDDVTYDGEIIEAPRPAAPLTLFGTDDPSAVVERATKVATVLADVIKQRHLSARIGNRDHIQIEGWTLLGSMLGVFGEVEWTRPVDRGWEARAVARTMAGATVGSAEAMCTRAERTWSNRDEYAIRSMAQTRALSKALRLPLGFIVELAGFAATPAEEMDAIHSEQGGERSAPGGQPGRAATTRSAPAPKNKGDALGRLAEVAKEHDLSFGAVDAMAKDMGISRSSGSVDDILRLIAAIEQPPSAGAHAEGGDGAAEEARASAAPDNPPSNEASAATADGSVAATVPPGGQDVPPVPSDPAAPAPSLDDIVAATGGEIVWPKPGSDAYKALPNGAERAKARAYWEAKKAEPVQESLAEAMGAPEGDR